VTWVQTVSGIPFDLLDPKPDMVRGDDIAHALSRIVRFNGHTSGEPYSVAHHSMLVADLLASWGAPPAIVREGLLHDAAEAYYGDIVSPLKRAMVAGISRDVSDFETVAARIDEVVRKTLGLPPIQSQLVTRADLVALAIERRDLFGSCERDWHLGEFAPTSAPCAKCHDHGQGRSFGMAFSDAVLRPPYLCSWNTARDRFSGFLRELDVAAGFEPATAEAA